MTSEALKTLFHPFDAGLIEPPARGTRSLFLGARPGFRLPDGFTSEFDMVQGFRPDFRALGSAGFAVAPQAEGDGYDLALVLAGRHRGQNERNIAEAIERVLPEGMIVAAGGKEDGIASLRKRIGGLVELEGALPKYHGAAFWFRRPEETGAAETLHNANPPTLVEGRFRTAPGMFSHDRVDAGSRLLADNLPADIKGTVADFCAGWGYLAATVAAQEGVRSLDLYEADFAALEAARANLAEEATRMPVGFHWHDLASEPVGRSYDAILMNPPFHRGHAADTAIGIAMIEAAASALKRGGRLFMVANRQLPYEHALDGSFHRWGEICRDARFKVLFATK